MADEGRRRGQYGAGTVLGKQAQAYRSEPNVAPIRTPRLHRLEAADRQLALGRGAVLPAHGKVPEAALDRGRHPLPPAPYTLFRGTHVEQMNPNWMILHIQPDEGISLHFAAKRPGPR